MKVRFETGISLIEVLVTVVVIGILATVAIPNMRDMIDARKLTNQTEAIADLMRLARSEAMKRAASGGAVKAVSATVSATSPWFLGLSNTLNTPCTGTTNCVLNQGGSNVPYYMTAGECGSCTITSTADLYTFSFRGIATAGRITVTSPLNRALRVDVSASGRVSVCVSAGTVTGYPSCA